MNEATRRIVAGALFDFAGFLTSRPGTAVIGDSHDATKVVELLQQFADARGISLDYAEVDGWEE